MKLIWDDKTFLKNEKESNYQLDSSRTTDSISNLISQNEISKGEEKEYSDFLPSRYKEKNNNEETFFLQNDFDEKNQISMHIINFKKYFSFVLCTIYLLLFLISIPKNPIKIGEERQINEALIRNNSNQYINILINNFNLFCQDNLATNINPNVAKNFETTGYLLEFTYNKMHIFRWFIGFFYFILKCIFFIYSNNKININNNFLNERIIKIVQKGSMLIFPLTLFYFDLQNKIVYTEIKSEQIDNKFVSFFIMKEKKFSMNDYVEALIPTLFVFLISFDYNSLGKIISNFNLKTSKLKKAV